MDFAALFALVGNALIALGLGAFVFWRGKAYLMFFQQEEYDAKRFRTWLKDAGGRDRAASLIAAAAAAVGLGAAYGQAWTPFVVKPLLVLALAEGLRRSLTPLKTAKKPLVMTQRVKRILQVYTVLGLGFAVAAWLTAAAGALPGAAPALAVILTAQAAPYLLIAADKLLSPLERRVKARFKQEAIEKLERLDPFVVAITGSYGKTTTKHILHHILSAAAPTLATPGSVNTEMGITRVVREQLSGEHRYFIVEMGAYGPGSIARLCQLAPPKAAIITAVGWAHYERFKTVETVFDAKFEMAEACRRMGGRTVINVDAMPGHKLEERLVRGQEEFIKVGRGEDADLRLVSETQTADGLRLEIAEAGAAPVTIQTPLFGAHQGQNVLSAVACARALGLPMAAIKAALADAPQTRHRLEVSKSGGIAVIDDAYNSNPIGFQSALALMDVLQGEGGRRILVTPGMVELGARHDVAHRALGEVAAKHADVALIVTPERIASFVEAFEANRPAGAELKAFARQADAEAWVKANARAGDVVLYENNLPDLYEAKVRF